MSFLSGLFGGKNKTATRGRHFDILSLSGGGIYSLYSARLLQHMEDKAGRHIGSKFDLIAGTSFGGITALAISREVPMDKMVQVFFDYGEEIFKPKSSIERSGLGTGKQKIPAGLLNSKCSPRVLGEVIDELLGEGAEFGDAKFPVLVTAYDVSTGSNRIFSAPISSVKGVMELETEMRDIALASSATPALFPIHEIGQHRFVDGSVFANSPDLVAFKHAIFNCEVPMEDLRMCSVGTMTGRFFLDQSVRSDLGLLACGNKDRLSTMMIAAQQQNIVNTMRGLLDESYIRLDTMSTIEDKADISSFTLSDMNGICARADNTWRIIKDEPLMKAFLK